MVSGAVNTIYLVRHGENPANLTREFSYRRVDYSLTEKGVLQARQTAEYLRGLGVDALYASPLRRAAQTATILGADLGLPVTEVEELREMNVGRLEDVPPTDESWALHDAVVDEWRAGRHDVTFPGGEDYHTLLARMRAALRQALVGREDQRIVLVGHGRRAAGRSGPLRRLRAPHRRGSTGGTCTLGEGLSRHAHTSV
jgi:probable phosphoglycerate mutase